MSDEELRELLQRTASKGGAKKMTQGPVKVKPPIPEYRQGQFAQQWSRLDEQVQPFKSPDINQTDMYAVIEAGHSQYKVVPDDKLFVNRLHGADVNDVIQFHRILLCGTPLDTLIGRPFLPGVTVTAAVEEHIRDSTVYIYKRRRAKGYRRFRGFRAELTGLRILSIHGTDGLGVPVPPWDPATSTPLHAVPTLGQRVRAWRKAHRRVQLRHKRDEADAILERWRNPSDLDEAYSEPYLPEEEPLAVARSAAKSEFESEHKGEQAGGSGFHDAAEPYADERGGQQAVDTEGDSSGAGPGSGTRS